jgi:hypothetical protein
MKKTTVFTIILVTLITACAPIIPASGGTESTPVVITAEVSTAVSSGSVNPFATQVPGTTVAFPTPEPPTPLPTLPSASLSPTELKYKVLDQFPDFFFCDPDFYPVARGNEGGVTDQQLSTIQSNAEEFQAILKHNGLAGQSTFADDQKLLIYNDYKKLYAIYFELVGDKYQFQIQTGSEGQQGYAIKGTIDGNGSIDIQQKEASHPMCPICLAVGTLIDTPHGAVRVEKLHVGDQVWTMNAAGERVAAVIVQTGSVRVPATHQVVHVILSDGRELWASPGHPTADGRQLADLKVGDMLDGAHAVLVERVPYHGSSTYDLLPSGGTGFYWANGILMGSTLK